jgi:hypothetical protein
VVDNIDYSPCSEAWFWGVPDQSISLSGELAFTLLKEKFGITLSASQVETWPSKYSGLNSFCNSLSTHVASVVAGEFIACTTEHKCKAEITVDHLNTIENPGFEVFVKTAALPPATVREVSEVLNRAHEQVEVAKTSRATTYARERVILDNLVARNPGPVYSPAMQVGSGTEAKQEAENSTKQYGERSSTDAGLPSRQPLDAFAGAIWASQIRDRHAAERIRFRVRLREIERETLYRLQEILEPEEYEKLMPYWPLIVGWVEHGQ